MRTLVLLAVLIAASFFFWDHLASIFKFAYDAFSGASDTVVAASIAAFVSIFTFLVGRYFEQARERKSHANKEKIRVYEQFFDFYFTALGSDVVDKPDDENWIAKFIFDFQKELLMWSPDSVLKAWIEFRKTIETTSHGSGTDQELVEYLAVNITAANKLLREMRRDIGYSFTTFSAKDLASFQIRSSDPNYTALLKRL